MPAQGLCLRLTHTGKAADSIHITDVQDGIDVLNAFRKAGPIYVPVPAKGGVALVVYSGDVAISYEKGGIRGFIDGGYLTAEFVAGLGFANLLPDILDEGILLTSTPVSINFLGLGVTATTVGDNVTVTIPGGAGVVTHPGLAAPGLVWTASGHTGTPTRIAAFDAGGVAIYLEVGVDVQAWATDLDALAALVGTGHVVRTGAGTYDLRTITGTIGRIVITDGDGVAGNPTIDLGADVVTVTGGVQGDILYFNGTSWARLPAGTSGETLTTQGAGSNPIWSGAGSTQLLWGSNSVASSTTTRYLFPGFSNNLSQTAVIQIEMVRAGTLRNFRVRHRVGNGNGNDIVYTIRVNGVATAIAATLASTATSGNDLVSTVVVAAGDLVDIAVTKALSVGSSPIDVTATVEFL